MKKQEWIKDNLEAAAEDLCTLVNIRSLRSEPAEGAPFGEGVRKGLEFFMRKAESFGFRTKNYDGYAVEIEIGKGEKLVGILGHVDVVDGGDGWSTDPFQAEITEGRIYGRGTVDDKGPLVCALYAMRYIEDHDLLPPGVSVRLIIGGDEESRWECMDYYKAHAERLPSVAMVVDGNFPVIYCEKGLLDFDMVWKPDADQSGYDIQVENLWGGSARNMVPSHAGCRLVIRSREVERAVAQLTEERGLFCSREGSHYDISFAGRPTHAMNPEKGRNAISIMMTFLADITSGRTSNINGFTESYNRLIGMDYNGKKMGLFCEDRETGPLTFNVGVIKMTGGQIVVEANLRIPASKTYQQVVPRLQARLREEQIEYVEESFLDPIHLEVDGDEISTLMEVYRRITGDEQSKPMAIGGATYARCLKNAVSFGPIFPGQEDRTHEADEFISVADMEKLMDLYAEGICRLAVLEKDA